MEQGECNLHFLAVISTAETRIMLVASLFDTV
jgi:hypothetical protein